MSLSPKQKLKYYKSKVKVGKIIKDDAKKDKHIIYGAKAVNAFMPVFMRKSTKDYDLFVKNPRKEARETERLLDNAFGADYFGTEKAEHKGTYRVRSKVTNDVVADYTKQPRGVTFDKLNNIRYANLDWQKKQIKKTLKDKNSKYRHQKDKETLQRINLLERFY